MYTVTEIGITRQFIDLDIKVRLALFTNTNMIEIYGLRILRIGQKCS